MSHSPEISSEKAGFDSDRGSISFARLSPEDRKRMDRKIKFKLDLRVVPAMSLLWLMAFLDRSNIGLAKVAGLSTELGLVGLQYNVCLAVFYILYVIIEIPSNVVLKKLGAKIWLPLIVLCWGGVTIATGFVHSYGGLLAVRLILGLCEGGLLPGIVLYMSFLYKRHELQMRIALFYASASLSGAFGGLLAYGFSQLGGTQGISAWRWIFILEGVITCAVAIFAFWLMPRDVKTASFLTPEERLYAQARLHNDWVSSRDTDAENNDKEVDTVKPDVQMIEAREQHVVVEEKFEMREIIRGITDIQVWLTGWAYMGICVSLYSFSLFVPSIVQGVYPTSSYQQVQLLTVPIFVPATALVVVMAYISDRYKARTPILLAFLPITMIGYIILLATDTTKPDARYAALFLIALGLYPAIPSILTILPNNCSGHYKRASATAFQLMLANFAGYPATFIYTADTAPRYVRPNAIVLAFVVFAWVLLLIQMLYVKWENKARAEGRRNGNYAKYDELVRSGQTSAPIGDRDPKFVYTI